MQSAYVPNIFTATVATVSSLKHSKSNALPRRRRRPSQTGARMSTSEGNEHSEPPTPSLPSWRVVRAQLHAGSAAAFEAQKASAYRPGYWAHPLSVPEPGCFLASHPAFYRREAPYLTQSVVFIVSFSPSNGARGLVLNRPLQSSATMQFSREVRDLVGSKSVYLGGPDGFEGSTLLMLHSDAAAATRGRGVHEPLPGVFISPMDITKGNRGATIAPSDPNVRVFAGCLRWPPGKLEAEIDSGEWFPISASEKFATSHCIQLPKPLWVEIMESQGEPFSKIARRIYGGDGE